MPNMLMREKCDRPREKLLARGSAALTNLELLQVMIGSGVKGADVIQISRQILRLAESQAGKITIEQLLLVRGVNQATATKLMASMEFMARLSYAGKKIEQTEDALPLLADIRTKKQEHVIVLTLDGGCRLIEKRLVGIGTVNSVLMHPREIFADALTDRASSIIVAHNHPGDTLEASDADKIITERLYKTGEIIGIHLLDHIIVTPDKFASIEVKHEP